MGDDAVVRGELTGNDRLPISGRFARPDEPRRRRIEIRDLDLSAGYQVTYWDHAAALVDIRHDNRSGECGTGSCRDTIIGLDAGNSGYRLRRGDHVAKHERALERNLGRGRLLIGTAPEVRAVG